MSSPLITIDSKSSPSVAADMADAYTKGKLNDVHYKLLNEKISKLVTDNTSKGKGNIEAIKKSPV